MIYYTLPWQASEGPPPLKIVKTPTTIEKNIGNIDSNSGYTDIELMTDTID